MCLSIAIRSDSGYDEFGVVMGGMVVDLGVVVWHAMLLCGDAPQHTSRGRRCSC